jgi:hypothetical protein
MRGFSHLNPGGWAVRLVSLTLGSAINPNNVRAASIPVFGMQHSCSKDCSERSKLPAGFQLLFPVSQDAAMKSTWIPFISCTRGRSFGRTDHASASVKACFAWRTSDGIGN